MVDQKPVARILRATGVSKSFPGVQALKDVSVVFNPGEVTAIVGENGAGKSTLMRILAGLDLPDTGTLSLGDTKLDLRSPADALKHGIALVPQEINVAQSLDGVANVLLGEEPSWCGIINRREARERANGTMETFGLTVPLDKPLTELEVSQQRIVEILRGLSRNADVIIMDEASASLGQQAMAALRKVTRLLAQSGRTVLFISHYLDEVVEISDRIIVMRDGAVVAQPKAFDTDPTMLTELMLGRPLSEQMPEKSHHSGGKSLLRASGLDSGRVRNFNLQARQYEIVGLFGAAGGGGTDIARLLAGVDRPDSGQIEIAGFGRKPRTQRDFMQAGVGFVPNDRKNDGLLLSKSVAWNLSLPDIRRHSRHGLLNRGSIEKAARAAIDRLSIKVSDIDSPVQLLSGGNQQKIVIGRWLSAGAQILVLDEATKGIDVGAKRDVYSALREFASGGGSVIYVSTEAQEVAALCDRAIVVVRGQQTVELSGSTLTERRLLEAAHQTSEMEAL